MLPTQCNQLFTSKSRSQESVPLTLPSFFACVRPSHLTFALNRRMFPWRWLAVLRACPVQFQEVQEFPRRVTALLWFYAASVWFVGFFFTVVPASRLSLHLFIICGWRSSKHFSSAFWRSFLSLNHLKLSRRLKSMLIIVCNS